MERESNMSIENYQRLESKTVDGAGAVGAKAISEKAYSSARPRSKATGTTAYSMNQSKIKSRGTALKSIRSKSGLQNKTLAVQRHTKPQSIMGNKNKHFETAGELLNYPYSFDQGGDRDL